MANNSKSGTRVVLLAAGHGKRMKSTKPKVLHEVLGRPILGRILSAADELNIEHVYVIIGHEAEQVRSFVESNPPRTPFSLHLQSPQLGTGHALQQIVPSLGDFQGTLLVSVADAPLLSAATLGGLLNHHQAERAVVTLLTADVDDAKNYGRIVRDGSGQVEAIVEDKDCTSAQRLIREINTAIYCFEWPAISEGLNSLKNENKQQEYYLTDIVGWAYGKGLKTSAALANDWRETAGINSRIELTEASKSLRDISVTRLSLECGVTVLDPNSTWISPEVKIGQDTTILPGCVLFGDITIGSNCTIGPNTYMHGRVTIGDRTTVIQSNISNSIIGNECKIGPFSHLRDNNDISNNVRIGNFVEIKQTAIAEKTNVSHLSYVGDANVGCGSNFGAGTITANYDHTTKKKSRTVIGDNVATGSNSVLVAPIMVGDGAVIAAGTVATKNVPARALAVGRVRQENKEGWRK
ncbi:MAG TPA: bifunctional UDP-N-acetylglucosamine diphosphorylase/glucosamine-1-phosphate N-acetyltransferase GlmU [Oculatellaceae cyanobacterium]